MVKVMQSPGPELGTRAAAAAPPGGAALPATAQHRATRVAGVSGYDEIGVSCSSLLYFCAAFNNAGTEANVRWAGKGSDGRATAYLLKLPQLKGIRALNLLLLLLLRLMMQLLLLRMALHRKGKRLRGQMLHLRRRSELRQWRGHGTSAFYTCDVLPAHCVRSARVMLLLLRC